MAFGTGILIKHFVHMGGVHKIQISIRENVEYFLRKFFGEEMGGGQGDPDPLVNKTFKTILGICIC